MLIVTALSLAVAVISGVIAWRVLRVERLRSAARVAALEAAIDGEPDAGNDFAWEQLPTLAAEPPHTTHAVRPGGRIGPILTAASILVIGIVVIVSMAMLADRDGPPAADAPAQESLELLSMTHSREGSAFVVSGLVRNAGRTETTPFATVITALDPGGRIVASGSASLPALAPGRTEPFTVRIDHVGALGRYRVSFRANGGVMPHVDRRGSRATPVVATE